MEVAGSLVQPWPRAGLAACSLPGWRGRPRSPTRGEKARPRLPARDTKGEWRTAAAGVGREGRAMAAREGHEGRDHGRRPPVWVRSAQGRSGKPRRRRPEWGEWEAAPRAAEHAGDAGGGEGLSWQRCEGRRAIAAERDGTLLRRTGGISLGGSWSRSRPWLHPPWPWERGGVREEKVDGVGL